MFGKTPYNYLPPATPYSTDSDASGTHTRPNAGGSNAGSWSNHSLQASINEVNESIRIKKNLVAKIVHEACATLIWLFT